MTEPYSRSFDIPLPSRKYYTKKFKKLLEQTRFEDLMLAVWHIDQTQKGNFQKADFFKNLPEDFKTTNYTSSFYVHKWRLETLISIFWIAQTKKRPNPKMRYIDLNKWTALARLLNLQHKIEDVESVRGIKNQSIFVELHRIVQRQFGWQRGYDNRRVLFRYMRIYNQSKLAEKFLKKYKLELNEFIRLGFCIYSICINNPKLNQNINLEEINISEKSKNLFLEIMSDSIDSAERYYSNFQLGSINLIEVPSRLRTHPIIRLQSGAHDFICAPLADLIFLRITEGLFYDFAGADNLKEIIANGFVEYCIELLERGRNDFSIHQEFEYKKNTNSVKSVDIFLKRSEKIEIAVECKARKMAHPAKFSTDPIGEATASFKEIAKGMVQLWRYVADSKAGFIPPEFRWTKDTKLVLLILDNWWDMLEGLRPQIDNFAHEIADGKNIPTKCRLPIISCSITCFEHIIECGTGNQIMKTFNEMTSAEYHHWTLSGVFNDINGELNPIDPFNDDDRERVIPWWTLLKKASPPS